MNLFIRKALPSDAPEICEMVRTAFAEYAAMVEAADLPALHETLEATLQDIRDKRVLIGFVNRTKAVGTVRYEILTGNIAYISRFAILQAWQQCGMGKALIAQVEQECREQGVAAIALHTGAKLTSQVHFYYANGFYIHATDTQRGYIRGLFLKELQPGVPLDLSAIL